MRVLLVLLIFSSLVCEAQRVYYVDDVGGSDKNAGTSKMTPFRSLDRVNAIKLAPGDSLLFRRGGHWVGNFQPQGSGSKNAMIVISSYGQGPVPVLDAKGVVAAGQKVSITVKLYNQEYIELRDLSIRNYKPMEVPSTVKVHGREVFVNAPKMALYIEGRDVGTLHEIHMTNLEITEVNGSMETKHNGGVFAEITWSESEGKRVPTKFDGLIMEACSIHHVDRTGWSNTSVWWDRSLTSRWGDKLANGKVHNWFPSERVIIRNCTFEYAGANALIVRVANNPLIEHCLFRYNGVKGSGNASFPFNCDNAVFQYNEACYSVYNSEADSWDGTKDADAGGFDSDWNCKNSLFQYNYSHHNGFGGILICLDGSSSTGFNDGTVIRYNIFEDNQHHVFRTAGPVTRSKIYNNVIYSGGELDSVMMVYHKSWSGYSDSVYYANNIFLSAGKSNYFDLGKSTRNIFMANTFYGAMKNTPADPKKSEVDPKMISPFQSDFSWHALLRFMLTSRSSAIDSGVEIKGHPGKDFLGRAVKGNPDRGAFEFDR